MPKATGTAKISAIPAVRTVPKAVAATPKRGGLSPANHLVSVRKLLSSALRAGMALTIRKTAMATMTTRTTEPAVVVVARNTVSAPNWRLRGSAPPPPGDDPAEVDVSADWLNVS